MVNNKIWFTNKLQTIVWDTGFSSLTSHRLWTSSRSGINLNHGFTLYLIPTRDYPDTYNWSSCSFKPLTRSPMMKSTSMIKQVLWSYALFTSLQHSLFPSSLHGIPILLFPHSWCPSTFKRSLLWSLKEVSTLMEWNVRRPISVSRMELE